MCQHGVEETIEHLFFKCPFGINCWAKFQVFWDHRLMDKLELVAEAKRRYRKPMFMEIFMVVAWSIWKERNDLVFNAVSPSIETWRHRFVTDFSLLVHRTKTDLHSRIFNLIDLIGN